MIIRKCCLRAVMGMNFATAFWYVVIAVGAKAALMGEGLLGWSVLNGWESFCILEDWFSFFRFCIGEGLERVA